MTMQFLKERQIVGGKFSVDKIHGSCLTLFRPIRQIFHLQNIESKVILPVAYRARQYDMVSAPESTSFTWRLSVKTAPEKPKFIIVEFQTDKDGDQTKNPSTFDHVNLKIAYVTLNSDRYPAVDYTLSFSNQKFSKRYGGAALFGVKFFGMDELITQSKITPSDYKTLYPLFTFDVSKLKEKFKSSVVDIQIEVNFTENVIPIRR